MSIKKLTIIAVIILSILTTACSSKTPEEKIQNHLEEAVALEEGFEKQQSKITDLEKQEQKIYNEIINLGMDEMDQIKKRSEQALETVDKRKDAIEKEQESIKQAREEFSNIEELINNLEDKEVKVTAKKMNKIMTQRYDSYGKLNKAYNDALKLEKKLYEMLPKKDLEQKILTDQVNKINETYSKVIEFNKEFNQNTQEYNKVKQDFYKQAGIEVVNKDTDKQPSEEK
ncbi:MAG: YkyA family protein [Virgibacillus proomii]|jgi:peptidoglycan hydrolase CwlO-like protein